MEKLYKKEKIDWVLDFYEKVRYLCGYREGLTNLKKNLSKKRQDSHFCNPQAMASSQLENIRNVFNEREINQILRTARDDIDDFYGFKKDMKRTLERTDKSPDH